MDYIHIWKCPRTYLIKIRIIEKVIMYKVISIYWNTMNNKFKFRCLDTEGCCGSCFIWGPGVTEKGVSVKDHLDQMVLWAYVYGELSGFPQLMGEDPAWMRALFPCMGPRESWRNTAHACLMSLLLTADMMWPCVAPASLLWGTVS